MTRFISHLLCEALRRTPLRLRPLYRQTVSDFQTRPRSVRRRTRGSLLRVLPKRRKPLLTTAVVAPAATTGVEPVYAALQARRLFGCTPRHHRRRQRGDDRSRTGVRGFAGRCLTTRPRRQEPAKAISERSRVDRQSRGHTRPPARTRKACA